MDGIDENKLIAAPDGPHISQIPQEHKVVGSIAIFNLLKPLILLLQREVVLDDEVDVGCVHEDFFDNLTLVSRFCLNAFVDFIVDNNTNITENTIVHRFFFVRHIPLLLMLPYMLWFVCT